MGAIFARRTSARWAAAARKPAALTVEGSHEILVNEESDKPADTDQLVLEAISAVREHQRHRLLDDIDKICVREIARAGDVSLREGRVSATAAADRGHPWGAVLDPSIVRVKNRPQSCSSPREPSIIGKASDLCPSCRAGPADPRRAAGAVPATNMRRILNRAGGIADSSNMSRC